MSSFREDIWYKINSLPKNGILDRPKLKALNFAGNNLNIAKMIISLFYKVENIVGKGENAGYQHFLLSPQAFQKACFSGSLKLGLCGK